MESEENRKSDQWFLMPRASDEIELTHHSFKAFGRILVWKLKRNAEDLNDEDVVYSDATN